MSSISGRGLRLVVVEDDAATRGRLVTALEHEGFQVTRVPDAASALAVLRRRSPHALVAGGRLSGAAETAARARAIDPALTVVLVTGPLTAERGTELLFGADDANEAMFASEADDASRLAHALAVSLQERRSRRSTTADPTMVCESPQMRLVTALVERVASVDVNVLISGESGVGKELIAQAIHRRSRRASAPLVAVNCAALTPSLMESELFGHERGAYTGADSRAGGLLESASGGTLLLDEIGELPLEPQAKFLRVIETGCFFRVGGVRQVSVDVRIVAATNRDLRREVAEGRFRQDLYYRLNTINVHVPPLRERPQDILPLARQFAGDKRLELDAEELLVSYSWPGNVRELRNAIAGAAVLSGPDAVTAAHLPRDLRDARLFTAGSVLREHERETILATLRAHGWHRAQAAERLGISIKTLYRKIKLYALEEEESLV